MALADAGVPGLPLLTLDEVAQQLRVSRRTVQRYIEDGFLHKVPMKGRLVRISRAELEKLAK